MKILLAIATLLFTTHVLARQPLVCVTNKVSASGYLQMVTNDALSTLEIVNGLHQSIESQLPGKNLGIYDLKGVRADFTEGGWIVSLSYEALGEDDMTALVYVVQDCLSGRPIYVDGDDTPIKVKVKL